MTPYQLTASEEPCTVIRTEDGASIPPDPANRDYEEYLYWVEDGGVPDLYIPPVPPPVILTADQRIDAGVSAAITTAKAALNALNAIPHMGPVPQRFEQLLTHTRVLAASYLSLLEALYDIYPEE